MADTLLDRVGPSDRADAISSHAFSAGIYLISIGSITRQQFINRFTITAEQESQLNELLNHINTLSDGEKLAFHGKFESLNVLREEGIINIEEYKALLNITSSL